MENFDYNFKTISVVDLRIDISTLSQDVKALLLLVQERASAAIAVSDSKRMTTQIKKYVLEKYETIQQFDNIASYIFIAHIGAYHVNALENFIECKTNG